MINIQNKNDCCGCTACYNICSHNAIEMIPDSLGFLYPIVNKDKCVDCGLCDKACGFKDDYDTSYNLAGPIAYAVRHNDPKEVNTSRSGGVFSALADYILQQDGVVYGVGYTGRFQAVHKRATNKLECYEFKGSKYVQSYLGESFKLIKEDLKAGIKVLFSGTPCQTSSLRSFLATLKVDTTNLYIVDIVCHGVPSPQIWQDYLDFIEKKHKKNIIAVDFRNKSKFGWTAHNESFKFEDGEIYSDTFKDLFYKHLILRDSCGNCHFSNLNRPSDITIGDLWGWENIDASLNSDDKGISLVLLNTEKGKLLFNEIQPLVNAKEIDISKCMQPNLEHPSVFHPDYEKFIKDYDKRGFKYVVKKYGNIRGRWRSKFEILKRKSKIACRLIIKQFYK